MVSGGSPLEYVHLSYQKKKKNEKKKTMQASYHNTTLTEDSSSRLPIKHVIHHLKPQTKTKRLWKEPLNNNVSIVTDHFICEQAMLSFETARIAICVVFPKEQPSKSHSGEPFCFWAFKYTVCHSLNLVFWQISWGAISLL